MSDRRVRLVERLHGLCAGLAAHVAVRELTMGLGYTAVALEDGGVGLAYTWLEGKECCSFARGLDEVEGGPASVLVDRLLSADALERSVGLAAVNALNHRAALSLPRDVGPAGSLVRELGITAGTAVGMVGYFPPVARVLEDLGATLDVVDDARRRGDRAAFEAKLGDGIDVLVMTSTTLLNDTADELLSRVGAGVRVALLGPSTPLLPEAFEGTAVSLLAGMAVADTGAVLRAVRHGAGTPQLQRFSRKVYAVCGAGGRA